MRLQLDFETGGLVSFIYKALLKASSPVPEQDNSSSMAAFPHYLGNKPPKTLTTRFAEVCNQVSFHLSITLRV
jgi:hypothetical protein